LPVPASLFSPPCEELKVKNTVEEKKLEHYVSRQFSTQTMMTFCLSVTASSPALGPRRLLSNGHGGGALLPKVKRPGS
jgi:hypothetical protein